MKVARICKGLPLALVIVSGLLATTEQQGWKAILDHLSSGNGVSGAEQCNIALELGYKHLPDYLQTCFLYFGAFPEDAKVSVKLLIRLWMAEGFVIRNESKSIEDVGREYVEKLIERSLVMVWKNSSLGGVKTCQIHDLLHGFCQSKMKQENLHLFLQTRDQLSKSNEMSNLQRLSIHTAPIDFKETRLFYPNACSLLFCNGALDTMVVRPLFDMSFIIQIFQLLKVLHMDRVRLPNGIPDEIGLLTRLTYLSFCTTLPIIPSSIGNLSNLETFIANFLTNDDIAFPPTLWNLQKLKCLYVKCLGKHGFTLPDENLKNSPNLLELETLVGVVFYSNGSMKRQLQKFPNIRRLSCVVPSEVIMDIPAPLESLTMRATEQLNMYTYVGWKFGSTAKNLRKLSIRGFQLSRENVGIIGKFPNLEVLKLGDIISFPDLTLGMEEEEFPKLRSLKLDHCFNLERWMTCDDELASLQKLEFKSCNKLEDIPSWLETSSTLEEIQVQWCSSALESLARDIKRVQKDYKDLFKLHIRSIP